MNTDEKAGIITGIAGFVIILALVIYTNTGNRNPYVGSEQYLRKKAEAELMRERMEAKKELLRERQMEAQEKIKKFKQDKGLE